MNSIAVIIPVAVIIIGAFIIFVISSQRNKKDSGTDSKKHRSRSKSPAALLKEANKRLTQNPQDGQSLKVVADHYFDNNQFEKAFQPYTMLIDLCAMNKELDEFEITLKYAMCALKLNRINDAYRALMICRGMKQEVFEVDFNLGILEFKRKQYEKAAALLLRARRQNPEHLECSRYLGQSLFKLGKMKEAALLLRKVIDLEPTDKETLFYLAQSYAKLGKTDQALKIYLHLRSDPRIGPGAAIQAGLIHSAKNQHEKAIMDFEIGLKHEAIPPDARLELLYNLAATYIQSQSINRAISLLAEIQKAVPDYKDVKVLLAKYEELNKNQNLQTYLIAPTSNFVTLCRRLCVTFFPKARIKITDISVRKNEYADILTEVNTRKWEDVILFRFVRSTGQIGELVVRDLYAKAKEMRAGRAYCTTAGTFTEGAQQFVEARLIDLVEKKELMEKLNSIDDSTII